MKYCDYENLYVYGISLLPNKFKLCLHTASLLLQSVNYHQAEILIIRVTGCWQTLMLMCCRNSCQLYMSFQWPGEEKEVVLSWQASPSSKYTLFTKPHTTLQLDDVDGVFGPRFCHAT